MTKDDKNESRMWPCAHGSTYCACKGNLASAMAIPGRSKAPPSHSNPKKAKPKKGGHGKSSLLE